MRQGGKRAQLIHLSRQAPLPHILFSIPGQCTETVQSTHEGTKIVKDLGDPESLSLRMCQSMNNRGSTHPEKDPVETSGETGTNSAQ